MLPSKMSVGLTLAGPPCRLCPAQCLTNPTPQQRVSVPVVTGYFSMTPFVLQSLG